MEESEYCDRLAIIFRGRMIASGHPGELKRSHMRDAVIEVDCDQPARALGLLATIQQIHDVALFGSGLRAVTGAEAAASEAVRRKLGAEGIKVRSIARVEPTLEDVFIALIEAHQPAEEART